MNLFEIHIINWKYKDNAKFTADADFGHNAINACIDNRHSCFLTLWYVLAFLSWLFTQKKEITYFTACVMQNFCWSISVSHECVYKHTKEFLWVPQKPLSALRLAIWPKICDLGVCAISIVLALSENFKSAGSVVEIEFST